MKKKVYLIINANDVDDKKFINIDGFCEQKIEEEVTRCSDREIYLKINGNEIDKILEYAKNRGYFVVNCGKTYILNKCFMGTKYTLFGKNISHEAINKFESDDYHNRYFFLCRNGKVDAAKGKDGKYYIKSVSENESKSVSENESKSVKKIFPLDQAILLSFSEYESDEKNKKKYTFIQRTDELSLILPDEEREIKYNGVPVKNIFKENGFSKNKVIEGQDDVNKEDQSPCVTFKGGKVFEPKNPDAKGTDQSAQTRELFSYDDIKSEEGEQLSKSSMRQYVFEGSSLYKKIESKQPNWQPETPYNLGDSFTEEESVLSIINEESRETYFSSLIAYALQLLPCLLEKVFSQKNLGNYKVCREENNVDILIRAEKKIIIIENKIYAGITAGEKNSWKDFITGKEKNGDIIKKIDEISSREAGVESQLSKYYNLALYYAMLNGLTAENISCYILCPEFKTEVYETGTKKNNYKNGKEYKVISYEKLYTAIKEEALSHLEKYQQEIIMTLKRAMKRYTYKQNNYFVEKICGRFVAEINRLKAKGETDYN